MPPDFLNSREDAALFWVVLALGFAIYKSPRTIFSGFVDVMRAFLQWKLVVLFGGAALYSAAVVYAWNKVGVWHTAALKATIIWFLGTAVVAVGEAVSSATPSGRRDFVRRLLVKIAKVTIVIEFIANMYALPFLFEVVCVFLILMALCTPALVRYDPSLDPRLVVWAEKLLIAIGSLYLANFVVRALADLDGFFMRSTAEDFLVGPALTVILVPLLLLIAWVSRREQERFRRRWRTEPAS